MVLSEDMGPRASDVQSNTDLGAASISLPALSAVDMSQLDSPLLPREVRRQAADVQHQVISLWRLGKSKESAFLDATEAIQRATQRVIEAAQLEEERLLSDLWIRHQRTMDQLARALSKVQDHVHAIVRLVDSADTSSMEWSLPSRSENTDLVIHRLDVLQGLADKIKAECGSVVTYYPSVASPALGAVRECAMSIYTPPVVPGITQKPRTSSHTQSHQEQLRESIRSTQLQVEVLKAANTSEESLLSNTDSSEPETKKAAIAAPIPAPRKRKLHRSLSVHARRTLAHTINHVQAHTEIKAELQYKLDSMGSAAGQLKQPTDALVLPNGNVLVADYNNRRLQEFDDQGQSVQMFTYPRIKPKAISLTHDHFIATIDGIDKNIKNYTRGAELVCRFGTGYFKDPAAIATNSKNQYVIIDSYSVTQKRVFVYDPMTGTRIWLGHVRDNYLFSNPEGVAVTHDDHILVTDAGHHCVFLFSPRGKLEDRFGREGQGAGELWYPKGVCVTQHNMFLVADCGNHRVCLFTQNGKYLSNVLDSRHGLHFPLNISMGADRLVVVQNAEVHVFGITESEPLTPTKINSRPSLANIINTDINNTDDKNINSETDVTQKPETKRKPHQVHRRQRSKSIGSVCMEIVSMATTGLSVLKRSSGSSEDSENMEDNPLEDGMLI